MGGGGSTIADRRGGGNVAAPPPSKLDCALNHAWLFDAGTFAALTDPDSCAGPADALAAMPPVDLTSLAQLLKEVVTGYDVRVADGCCPSPEGSDCGDSHSDKDVSGVPEREPDSWVEPERDSRSSLPPPPVQEEDYDQDTRELEWPGEEGG